MTLPIQNRAFDIASLRQPSWLDQATSALRTTTLVVAAAMLGAGQFSEPLLAENPVEEIIQQDEVQQQDVQEAQQQQEQEERRVREQQDAERRQKDQYEHDRVIEDQNNARAIEEQRQRQEDLQRFLQKQRNAPGGTPPVPPYNIRDPNEFLRQLMLNRNAGWPQQRLPAPSERRPPAAPPAAPIDRPQAKRLSPKPRSRLAKPQRRAPIHRPAAPPPNVSRPANRTPQS